MEDPPATVGNIDAYRLSATQGLGNEVEARVAWCERHIGELLQVVANPRAAVGLQAAMARRQARSRDATPPREAPPACEPGSSPPAESGV